MCLLQIFNSRLWFLSHSLNIVFHRAQIFYFNEAHLINFFFHRSCLELIFVKSVRFLSNFLFCMWTSSFSRPLIEKTIFAPLLCLFSFLYNDLAMFMWVKFWDLCSVLVINLYILSPILYCLDYYSFIVVLNSDSVSLCSVPSILYWLFWVF